MENIVVSYFNIESEAYQALSDLKKLSTFDEKITFSQVAILKKVDGQILFKDGFDTGKQTIDDTWKGGLIGGLVGILGGPVGVLLGLGLGSVIGAAIDSTDVEEEDSLLASVTSRLKDGDVVIMAVVQEETEASYDRTIEPYDAVTVRYDASFIQEEVEHANELQKELERQTKEKIKEKRTESRQAKVAEYKAKIKNEFLEIKQKMGQKK
ncbi:MULTISPECIES: DUF1269 domain-containing protein [Bacillus]|uniref:DUF1269 domain-containing protein n=1 Tax=Bacillus TaxID=1386 RepID=UPI0002D3941F|nr:MULTISPECIES: DUF1269 domain-containing protein [Bacillus]